MKTKNTHWHLSTDENDIGWLSLDKKDSSTNTLSTEVLLELETIVDSLAQHPVKGLIFQSVKPSGFIAGADVNEFTTFQSESDALTAIERGQSIFNKIEELPFPTLALIKGYCLGGGMELALACTYRIAENSESTKLGLPEVKLGIHPGFGGTVRAFRLLDPLKAFDLILSGRNLSASAAKHIGLIDFAVPERHLLNAARETVLKTSKQKKQNILGLLLNHRLARPYVARFITKNVAKKAVRNHYPAPYAVIDLWQHHFDNKKTMMKEEAASVARLIVGKTAQNLIRVFKLQELLKSQGNSVSFQPEQIHVIGAGIMGGDIAIWCAMQGYKVTLQDTKHESLARVMQRANKLYQQKLKKARLVTAALDRLTPDMHGNGLKRADVVIEAIFEDIETKRRLFENIEPKIKETALIATNTSSIPLEKLSTSLNHPERLVGLHFFNPVAKMPLVEIIHGEQTSPEVITQASTFTKQIRRLPLPVKSSPGFLVNRILMPYLIEAVTLADEGIPLKAIDDAAVDFGMPMGPIELADTVGLDICLNVAEILSTSMNISVPEKLKQLVDTN
ncbi:MAG: 3-hydroxyacyl-CoA dehydrogenase NAD-binding domain-containing protein, partial [Gammaproteobacteria bacterium]